jgi:nitrogen fixation/metabolism regulation signal transduction histidine kinase
VWADLLLEIQEAMLAMTERIDSLLQFGSSGRNNPLVHGRVSLLVENAVAAVKFHPDGRNVSITVGEFPPAKAVMDVRSLESAIYNLLLNACQAATHSTHLPEVKVSTLRKSMNRSASRSRTMVPAYLPLFGEPCSTRS